MYCIVASLTVQSLKLLLAFRGMFQVLILTLQALNLCYDFVGGNWDQCGCKVYQICQ